MPRPMSKRDSILERDQRLQQAEAEAKAELQRITNSREQLASELEAEANAEAEAAAYAAKQGVPVDIARQRIARERGQEQTTDAALMSKEQYLEYRRKVHGF